jgi:hypothetical protein
MSHDIYRAADSQEICELYIYIGLSEAGDADKFTN